MKLLPSWVQCPCFGKGLLVFFTRATEPERVAHARMAAHRLLSEPSRRFTLTRPLACPRALTACRLVTRLGLSVAMALAVQVSAASHARADGGHRSTGSMNVSVTVVPQTATIEHSAAVSESEALASLKVVSPGRPPRIASRRVGGRLIVEIIF